MATVRDRLEVAMAVTGATQANNSINAFGDTMNKLKGTITSVIGVYAGFKLLKDAITNANEQLVANRKLNSTLQTTGNVLNTTTQLLNALANQLQKTTATDDAIISRDVISTLLTFKNLNTQDLFRRTTLAAIDMAAQFGGDVRSAAIQLGKALQLPIAGVGALSRVGVTFSLSQKLVIKKLVLTGQAAKAQDIILKLLLGQVKGVAASMATLFDKIKLNFGDTLLNLGNIILPDINKALGYLNLQMSIFNNNMTTGSNLPNIFDKLFDVAKIVGIIVVTKKLLDVQNALSNSIVRVTKAYLENDASRELVALSLARTRMAGKALTHLQIAMKASTMATTAAVKGLIASLATFATTALTIAFVAKLFQLIYKEATDSAKRVKNLNSLIQDLTKTISSLNKLDRNIIDKILGDIPRTKDLSLLNDYLRKKKAMLNLMKNFEMPTGYIEALNKITLRLKLLALLSKTVVPGTKSQAMVIILTLIAMIKKGLPTLKLNIDNIKKLIASIGLIDILLPLFTWDNTFNTLDTQQQDFIKYWFKDSFPNLLPSLIRLIIKGYGITINDAFKGAIGITTLNKQPIIPILSIIPTDLLLSVTSIYGYFSDVNGKVNLNFMSLFSNLTQMSFDWAAAFAGLTLNVFGKLGQSLIDNMKNTFNQILNDFLTSGLLSLIAMFLSGGSAGFVGSGLFSKSGPLGFIFGGKETSVSNTSMALNLNNTTRQNTSMLNALNNINNTLTYISGQDINPVQLSRKVLLGTGLRTKL